MIQLWRTTLEVLDSDGIPVQQRAFLSLAKLVGLLDDTALIAVPNDFTKDIVETRLRDRVTARVARTTSAAACSTFHSFAYALVRKYAPAELYEGAIRLLSAPEADVVLRELLRDNPESVMWPEQLRRAAGTRGFVVEAVLPLDREAVTG